MTNSSSMQQQLQQQQYSSTQQHQKYMAGIYIYILVRRIAAYNAVVVTIYQVRVLCCQSAHTVPNKESL